MFFELTHRCNLACRHCGSDCVRDTRTPDLPAEDILRVLKEIKDSGKDPSKITVALSGGEPLCYPNLWELGRQIARMGFPWGMVTNGFAWHDDSLAKALHAGMGSITLSLDGLKDDHDWLRGKEGSFERVMAAIDSLRDYTGNWDVITCVNERNIGDLEEIRALLIDHGVKMWRFFMISPIGRAAKFPELTLSGPQLRRLFEKVIDFRNRGEIDVCYSESGYLGSEFEQKVRSQRYLCLAGIMIAGVMVNGDILACPNIDRRFAQGNIYRDSFIDVWENRYRQFRDRRWMRQGDCADCEHWTLCLGNSFHLWDLDQSRTRYCHCQRLKER